MRKILILLLLITAKVATAQTAEDYYKEAKEFCKKRDYKSALKSVEKSIKIDGANDDYYTLKGNCLYKLKQNMDAYDTYNTAISINKKKADLYNNRGFILETYMKFDEAIMDYTTAMELAKNDTNKNAYLANRDAAKLKKRDFNGAYDDLIISYKFDSNDIGTLTNLGTLCMELGKNEETLKYLLRVIEIDPSFDAAYGNIGYLYQRIGQYEKSNKYYNKVLELDPNEPLGYSNRSYNKYKLGDLKGAKKDIEKSIKLYPTNSYAYRIRALIYIEEKKIDKACEDLKTAIDMGFAKMYGDEVETLKKKYCK
ncbi:MAG: tetratricopeptide repeat protein [Bacteroidetes bacterium]|nr:tetratricopeptide repeat protein [Bacteroidota bacterium]